MYAIARDCRWKIAGFHWRPVYCTFHLCFVDTASGANTVVIGADAPVAALSRTSEPNDGLQYVDDAAFSSAAAGNAPDLQVLIADDLKRDLSEVDRAWLIALERGMDYDLKYWRPVTAGDVIFNTWD
jgi:hypothetical protein